MNIAVFFFASWSKDTELSHASLDTSDEDVHSKITIIAVLKFALDNAKLAQITLIWLNDDDFITLSMSQTWNRSVQIGCNQWCPRQRKRSGTRESLLNSPLEKTVVLRGLPIRSTNHSNQASPQRTLPDQSGEIRPFKLRYQDDELDHPVHSGFRQPAVSWDLADAVPSKFASCYSTSSQRTLPRGSPTSMWTPGLHLDIHPKVNSLDEHSGGRSDPTTNIAGRHLDNRLQRSALGQSLYPHRHHWHRPSVWSSVFMNPYPAKTSSISVDQSSDISTFRSGRAIQSIIHWLSRIHHLLFGYISIQTPCKLSLLC